MPCDYCLWDYAPKKFLDFTKQRFGDMYVFDCYVTGKQSMMSYGLRRAMKRRDGVLRHNVWVCMYLREKNN